jgi:hypothetical protein
MVVARDRAQSGPGGSRPATGRAVEGGPRSRRWLWRWALAALSLAMAAVLGCQGQPGAELLQVSAIVPAEVQFGDSVQIAGDGFALGTPVTVRLRGEVHRAGQAPKSVDLSLRARTESQRELGLELPRMGQALFCGDRDEASHATFRGDVQVAIAAKAPGAPPVTGVLHGAVLELYPAFETRAAEAALQARGEHALAFFGIEVGEARGGGLSVQGVVPGSRAASAGLLPGDRILRAFGLSVFSPSDLVPEPTRTLELGVVRGLVERRVWLDADGLTPVPPRESVWAAVPIATAALGFCLWASPLSSLVDWLVRNLIEHRRSRLRRPSEARVEQTSRWLRLLGWLGGSLGVLVWLGIASALVSPALRQGPVDRSLGLLTLFFAVSTAIGVWSLLDGGRERGGWSFRRGLSAAWQSFAIAAPGWMAWLAIGSETGVDFDDLVRGQGAWPWTWNAFSNPGLSLACVLLILTALPRMTRPRSGLPSARPPRLWLRARGDNVLGWSYLCAVCAVAAVAFLGGDAWPGEGTEVGASLPAALALLAKYTGLVLGVAWLRALCLDVSREQWSRLSLRIAWPLSVAGALLAHGFRALGRLPPLFAWLHDGFAPAALVLIVLIVLAAAAVYVCVELASDKPSAPARLSPWL